MPAKSKTCPRCNAAPPSSCMVCECGYHFPDYNDAAAAAETKALRLHKIKRALSSLLIGVILLALCVLTSVFGFIILLYAVIITAAAAMLVIILSKIKSRADKKRLGD